MRVTKIKHEAGHTTDGTLKSHQGRVVIYDGFMMISHGNNPDHLTLLSGLAAKYHFKKDDVISGAIRMYYTIEDDVVILSASRKIDENMFFEHSKKYAHEILLQLHG